MRRAALLVALMMGQPAWGQTPTPAVPWNEAQLEWAAPATFVSGGSLADCGGVPCAVKYVVEASAPGGNGWGPIAIISTVTTYRVKGLYDGQWQFRVRAFWGLTGYSAPGPVAVKDVKEPTTPEPVVTPPTAMIAK